MDILYNNEGNELEVGGSGSVNADTMRVRTFNSSYNTITVDNKREEFCANIEGKGNIETFLFFTDPHLTPQSRYETMTEELRDKYVSALQKYYNSLPLDYCICGGDWLNYHANDNKEAMSYLGYCDAYMHKLFKNYHCVFGNHDTNPYNISQNYNTTPININSIKNLLFRGLEDTYYSFDGLNTKFYVLDSGVSFIPFMTGSSGGSSAYKRWEQVAWLADKLSQDDADNSIVVLHIYSNATLDEDWYKVPTGVNNRAGIQDFGKNVKSLCVAYNNHETIELNSSTYDFSSCNGKIDFILCGHSHRDYVDCDGDIPIVNTTNLEGGYIDGNNTYQNALIPTFDCCLLDNDEHILYCTRIGKGKSRIVHCEPVEIQVGETFSFVSELSGTITWSVQERGASNASVNSGAVTGLAVGYAGIIASTSTHEEYWIVKVVNS